MVGDYLFALAAAEMALAPDPRYYAYFSHGVMTICAGELSPVMDAAPFDTATEQYLYKIGCKTAALFEAACKAGMVCGGSARSEVDALGRFGYQLGLAFQIVDDVLDYTADAATLGKPAGNDLREGTITLPLIYAVAAGADGLIGLLDARPIIRRGSRGRSAKCGGWARHARWTMRARRLTARWRIWANSPIALPSTRWRDRAFRGNARDVSRRFHNEARRNVPFGVLEYRRLQRPATQGTHGCIVHHQPKPRACHHHHQRDHAGVLAR